MADTDHVHGHHTALGDAPVEGDGIHYGGVIWFMVVLALTVIGSQVLVMGSLKYLKHQANQTEAPRQPLAPAVGQLPPAPNLLYEASGTPELNERGTLSEFRAKEDAVLNGYNLDKATGAARIPIEKAKALLLQRGLPTAESKKQ
jgi:hypothetical protein